MEDQKLKLVHIDIENKVFEVNGKPLPKDCDDFKLTFESGEWNLTYNVRSTLGNP